MVDYVHTYEISLFNFILTLNFVLFLIQCDPLIWVTVAWHNLWPFYVNFCKMFCSGDGVHLFGEVNNLIWKSSPWKRNLLHFVYSLNPIVYFTFAIIRALLLSHFLLSHPITTCVLSIIQRLHVLFVMSWILCLCPSLQFTCWSLNPSLWLHWSKEISKVKTGHKGVGP